MSIASPFFNCSSVKSLNSGINWPSRPAVPEYVAVNCFTLVCKSPPVMADNSVAARISSSVWSKLFPCAINSAPNCLTRSPSIPVKFWISSASFDTRLAPSTKPFIEAIAFNRAAAIWASPNCITDSFTALPNAIKAVIIPAPTIALLSAPNCPTSPEVFPSASFEALPTPSIDFVASFIPLSSPVVSATIFTTSSLIVAMVSPKMHPGESRSILHPLHPFPVAARPDSRRQQVVPDIQ